MEKFNFGLKIKNNDFIQIVGGKKILSYQYTLYIYLERERDEKERKLAYNLPKNPV